MHVWFVPIYTILISIHAALATWNIIGNLVGKEFLIYFTFKCLLLCTFWLEFHLKVEAFAHKSYSNGLSNYFKDLWHKTEFILLLFLTVKTCMNYTSYYPLEEQPVYYGYTFVTIKWYVNWIDWVYLLRYLKLVRSLFRYLANLLEKKIDKKYSDGYDLGKAIVTADTELIEMLPTLVDDEKIRQDIIKNLELRREKVNIILGQTAKERPSIAVSVKTKQAIHSILNVMKQSIQELRQAGYIDSIEYTKLTASIEKLVCTLNRMEIINQSSPKVLFREIPWMTHNDKIINYLYRNVVIRTYDTGVNVMEKGRVADGIYVVVTGLLKLKYVPYTESEILSMDIGAVLIIDYLSSLDLRRDIDDYIVSGNSIGELSFLTNRPYNCTITAESPVQIYHISLAVMKAAVVEFHNPIDGLMPMLWKASCFQLATMLLLSSPLFQYHTAQQIQEHIERAFVPDLYEFLVLVLNELVQDVLLLDGMAVDYETKEVYLPPYYIPRTSQKLLLNKDFNNLGSKVETRLMIIPVPGIQPSDIMERLEQLAESPTTEMLSKFKHVIKKRIAELRLQKSQAPPENMDDSTEQARNIRNLVSGTRVGTGTGASILKDGAIASSPLGLTMDNMLKTGVRKKGRKSSKMY